MQTDFILLAGFFSDILLGFGILIGIVIIYFVLYLTNDSIKTKTNQKNQIFEDLKSRITNSKHKRITQLNQIEKEIDDLIKNIYNPSNKDVYDPIESIKGLQNLLRKPINNEANIWKQLFANINNPYKTIFNLFNKKISSFENLNEIELLGINENDKIELKNYFISMQNEVIDKKNKLIIKYDRSNEKWKNEFDNIENNNQIKKEELGILKDKYFQNDKYAVQTYNKYLLEFISFDKNFKKDIQVEFNPENKVLIVEYLLPSIDNFPNIKEIRYLKTKNEYKNLYYSQKEMETIYENATYQIVLSLINRLFLFDEINQIDTIIFNGWTKSLNKATGLINEACILSVACNKEEYLKINLPEVDPKECFKALKGISAHKISNLTPIKPIITIDQNDKRFISSHNVEIDDSVNLASMNWEDFEHLIREIFEKEFSSNGGNVKVTQSSRDGGVDAIAFDPDPIRGGKIVIQAKRYTNVVGVSAVRDLYGTVLNEGATKGILVTTSDYGSDSYNFAKDKPLTLLNGSNLLHLLESHNYKARINIKEAREELKTFDK